MNINEQLGLTKRVSYARALNTVQPQLGSEDWSLDFYNDRVALDNPSNANGDSWSNASDSVIKNEIDRIRNASGSSRDGKDMYCDTCSNSAIKIAYDKVKKGKYSESDIEEFKSEWEKGCNKITKSSRKGNCLDYLRRKTSELDKLIDYSKENTTSTEEGGNDDYMGDDYVPNTEINGDYAPNQMGFGINTKTTTGLIILGVAVTGILGAIGYAIYKNYRN